MIGFSFVRGAGLWTGRRLLFGAGSVGAPGPSRRGEPRHPGAAGPRQPGDDPGPHLREQPAPAGRDPPADPAPGRSGRGASIGTLVLHSSKAVHEMAAEVAVGTGRAAPDPRLGAMVELLGGQRGDLVDLVAV